MLTPIVVNSASDLPDSQLPAGSVTLRDAVATANADGSGDTISFSSSLAGSTITLTQGELVVTGSMTITGLQQNGQPINLPIVANGASRDFNINGAGSQSVTLKYLTLQSGVFNQTNLSLTNDALDSQVGYSVTNSGTLIVQDDVFHDGGSSIFNTSIANISHSHLSGSIDNSGTLTSAYNSILANVTNASGTLTSTYDRVFSGVVKNINGQLDTLNDIFEGGNLFVAGPSQGANGITHSTNDTFISGGFQTGVIDSEGTFIGVNDTISGNYIGVNAQQSQNTTLINCIVAGNFNQLDLEGSLTAQSSHNLIGIPQGMTLSNILQTIPNSNPLQPLLTDNAGLQQSIALVLGSPAIGQGEALGTVTPAGDGGTTLTVDNTSFIGVGDYLRIGSEIVQVSAVDDAQTLTVSRALQGTTQNNLDGLPVTLAYDGRLLPRNTNDLGSFAMESAQIADLTLASGDYTSNRFSVTNADVLGFKGRLIASFGNPSLSYEYYVGTLSQADLANATPLSSAPFNVGNYTVVAMSTNIPGYLNATSAPVHFSILPQPLTISATTTSKTYDGTTSSATLPTVTGLEGSDIVVRLSQSFESKNVLGNGNSTVEVNPGFVVLDHDGGLNYAVTVVGTASGTITPAPLTISAVNNTKVYNATTAASAIPTVFGLVGSDTVTGLAESYQSKNVLGTAQSILQINSGYLVNDGNHGNNYSVVSQTSAGTINPHNLAILATPNIKVYDGTLDAAAIPTASGLMGTDHVSGLTEDYGSKNVMGANGSTLGASGGTLEDGNNGHNYIVIFNKTAMGTITPATLTISATSSAKVYDGTTSTFAEPIVSGLMVNDSVAGLSEAYASRNALGENGSTLIVTGYTVTDGNNGNNYHVNLASAAGTIRPAFLILSATTNTKVYDGTTTASAVPTVQGLIDSDTVTGLAESYVSKNVLGANGSLLAVTSYTIDDGNGGHNYAVVPTLATGTITPASLTISATPNTKVYDKSTTANALPTVIGLLGTDSVTGLAETYTSPKPMGTNGSTLVVTADKINDANNGNNYIVTLKTAKGTITRR